MVDHEGFSVEYGKPASSTDNSAVTSVDIYSPFSNFAAWTNKNFHREMEFGGSYVVPFERAIEKCGSDDAVERLIHRMIREAAAETGAIEDVYSLPPGASRSIANETANWEGT